MTVGLWQLSTLFDALVEEGTDVLQAQRCTLWLVDEGGDTVSQKVTFLNDKFYSNCRFKV